MRLSTQYDSGGARARSEERAWCLIPFSQITRVEHRLSIYRFAVPSPADGVTKLAGPNQPKKSTFSSDRELTCRKRPKLFRSPDVDPNDPRC